jgi:hypothetical protein
MLHGLKYPKSNIQIPKICLLTGACNKKAWMTQAIFEEQLRFESYDEKRKLENLAAC